MILRFLTGFAGDLIDPLFRVSEYFGFLVRMCLVFGLAFQLPVVSFVLTRLRVIDHRFLSRYFRHAIVVIFITAAILTPTPDALSQLLLALPLVGLYSMSILIAYFCKKK